MSKHSHIKSDDISSGYIAYNGYTFNCSDAKGYNAYNVEIKRAMRLKDGTLLKSLLDRRAHYFKLVICEI